MRHLKGIFSVAIALVGFSVFAVPSIDQNQPNTLSYIAAFAQGDLAQSFRQDNGDIAGAGIFLQAGVGSTANVLISLWDKLPNQSGASLLASGFAIGTAGSWLDVFWSPVNVTPGNTYYLVFSGNNTLGIAGSVANPYSGGQTYANHGFQSFATFDYAFRTYHSGGNGASVPDGGSALALLGLALAGVQTFRWRLQVR